MLRFFVLSLLCLPFGPHSSDALKGTRIVIGKGNVGSIRHLKRSVESKCNVFDSSLSSRQVSHNLHANEALLVSSGDLSASSSLLPSLSNLPLFFFVLGMLYFGKQAKDVISLADWRNVNIGLPDRRMTSRANLSNPTSFQSTSSTSNSSIGENGNKKEDKIDIDKLQREKNELEYEEQIIEAIEQRNRAQIDSFVDALAQWNAQSEEDRQQLMRKKVVEERLEEIKRLLEQQA